MKQFIQIIVQEKMAEGSGDWRAFCIAKDSEGNEWELRGYGTTPEGATKDAYSKYKEDETLWDIYGYITSCS